MAAPLTKWDLTPVLSHNASYRVSGDEQAAIAPRVSFARRLADTLAFLVAIPARQRVLNELATLSDRDLADIGLVRGDLGRVFNQAFIAEREADRRQF